MKKLIFIIVLFFSFNVMATTFVCNSEKATYILINEEKAKESNKFGYVSDAKLIITSDSGTREYDAAIVSKDWYGDVIFLKGFTYDSSDQYGLYVFFFRIEKTAISEEIVFRIWYGLDNVTKGTCTKSR